MPLEKELQHIFREVYGREPTVLVRAPGCANLPSDVPIAAGLSSSAALEMAFVLAWEALAGFELDGVARAQIGQRTENEYLGVDSGITGQFACVHGVEGHLVLLDCRTLTHELIPLPPAMAAIVADSGVRRELAHSDYNSRPKQCWAALTILQQHLPEIRALRDVSPEAFELHAHHLPEVLRRRARHVVEEGARFGGGGFGGCVQVLAEQAAVPAIKEAMSQAFVKEFGRVPAMFTTVVADGAEYILL